MLQPFHKCAQHSFAFTLSKCHWEPPEAKTVLLLIGVKEGNGGYCKNNSNLGATNTAACKLIKRAPDTQHKIQL